MATGTLACPECDAPCFLAASPEPMSMPDPISRRLLPARRRGSRLPSRSPSRRARRTSSCASTASRFVNRASAAFREYLAALSMRADSPGAIFVRFLKLGALAWAARGPDRDDQARVRRRGGLGLRGDLQEDAGCLSGAPRSGGARAVHLLRPAAEGGKLGGSSRGSDSCCPALCSCWPLGPLRRGGPRRAPR